jgi:hypothetical protein
MFMRSPPHSMLSLGAQCFGAYTFTLSDGTGSIVVEVPSICGRSQDAITIISETQQVSTEVRIEAPGYYTGQGITPPGEFKAYDSCIALHEPIVQDTRQMRRPPTAIASVRIN